MNSDEDNIRCNSNYQYTLCLPEGTSGDILDGKISTPKPKKIICFEG
jgi:hypothetical protein